MCKSVQSLMAILLLLTTLCQSALPCGCARCSFGVSRAAAACECPTCDGVQCKIHPHHIDRACCNSDLPVDCCHCPHETQNSCPNSSESTCRRTVVFFSGSGSELQLTINCISAFGWEPATFTGASVNFQHILTRAERDICAFESPHLTGCVRLQV